MKLTRAEFTHFKILDAVNVKFDVAQTNIFFVNGFNGRGKTSFQDALYWCLYGRAPEDGVANRHALGKKKGTPLEVSAAFEFQLEDDEFESVEIRRSTEVTLEQGVQRTKNARLSILGRNPGGSSFTEPVANEEQWIHQRFPDGLKQFFLFDGESLEKFFVNTTKERIGHAVREIAGVEAFEGIDAKLGLVINEWRKQLAKGAQSNTALSSEVKRQKYQRATEESQVSITAADKLIASLEKELAEIDLYFERFGNNSGLLQEESEVRGRISSLKTEIQAQRFEQHNRLLSEGLEFAVQRKILDDVVREQEDAIKNDEYPPQFSENLMKKIVEIGRCVCGEEVAPGSEKHHFLRKLIDEHRDVDAIGQDLQKLCAYAEYWPSMSASMFQGFSEQSKTIAQKVGDLEEFERKLEELQARLMGGDREEQQSKIERKKKIPYEISTAETERSKAVEQRDWALAEVKNLEKSIDKLTKSSSANEKINGYIARAEALNKAARLAHRAAVDSVRTNLEKAVDEEFKVIKTGAFKTQITDDFEVRTVASDGGNVKLSSGENMMKAYVFALALRKVIGFKFPLVVDTPFGRLDSENRKRLVDMITRLNSAKGIEHGNQVIFLMHDLEYTPQIKETFSPNNPVEMYLAYQKEEEVSQVHEGIDPAWFKTDSWKGWKAK
jgi:DNA sulfur modification protein DndD